MELYFAVLIDHSASPIVDYSGLQEAAHELQLGLLDALVEVVGDGASRRNRQLELLHVTRVVLRLFVVTPNTALALARDRVFLRWTDDLRGNGQVVHAGRSSLVRRDLAHFHGARNAVLIDLLRLFDARLVSAQPKRCLLRVYCAAYVHVHFTFFIVLSHSGFGLGEFVIALRHDFELFLEILVLLPLA